MSVKNLTEEVIENKTMFKSAHKPAPHESKLTPQASQEYTLFKATVIPCGSEDQSDYSEEPYEIVLSRSNSAQQNLKDILNQNQPIWCKVFGKYMVNEQAPNFSLYRTPFETDSENSNRDDQELFLHILYMKSTEKTLTRNYNAQELEIFCHNRFYGPLIVAFNRSKSPFQLISFTLDDLKQIEMINRSFQNKSIKDDFVPACLLNCSYLNHQLT
jgi:hypothetical protein